MTTPEVADDLSLRSVLDSTLKDFGVEAAPVAMPQPAEPALHVDIKQLPFDRRTQALIAIGALLLVAVVSYLWGARQPTAAPEAGPTLAATLAPTPAPTIAPTAAPAALVGYFDYSDPSSAAP